MNLFQEYGLASCQFISLKKSCFFASTLMTSRIVEVKEIMGYNMGFFPFCYLGVRIFQGCPKKEHFQPIVDKIMLKLAKWKGALLSIIGHMELIVESIIQGMLIFSFHIYAWPIMVLKTLDKWIHNFIWRGDIYSRKLVTVVWATVGHLIHIL